MDKPFRTIEEQVSILRRRGMLVDDEAASVLAREGYYSIINGYKVPFIDKRASQIAGEDSFKQGTTFDEVYLVYDFDRNLRMTMFKYFAIAEAALKTACAYQFSKAHLDEAEPYLDGSNYRREQKYKKLVDGLISDFSTALGRNPAKRPKSKAYLEHYRKKYDEVPLWVLLRYMTLGQTFKFYEFQNESMRNSIAKHFSDLYAKTHDKPIRISERRLRLAYDHIKDFRNICAHDERLYCARVSKSKSVSISEMINDLGIILPKDENVKMVNEVLSLLLGIANDLSTIGVREILDAMGMKSIEDTMYVRE